MHNIINAASATAATTALQQDMAPRNPFFRSPDPLDQSDPLDESDPLDQANEKEPPDPSFAQSQSPALNVRALRKRLHMPQRLFAGSFGFPVATLRHWERGDRRPSGTALVLLHVIGENPQLVMRAVRRARLRDPGSVAPIEPITSTRAPPGFVWHPPPRRKR